MQAPEHQNQEYRACHKEAAKFAWTGAHGKLSMHDFNPDPVAEVRQCRTVCVALPAAWNRASQRYGTAQHSARGVASGMEQDEITVDNLMMILNAHET